MTGRRIGKEHHIRVGHPIRRGDYSLVTRIEYRHTQVVDRLFCTGGDQNLRTLIVKAIVARELRDHGIF